MYFLENKCFFEERSYPHLLRSVGVGIGGVRGSQGQVRGQRIDDRCEAERSRRRSSRPRRQNKRETERGMADYVSRMDMGTGPACIYTGKLHVHL